MAFSQAVTCIWHRFGLRGKAFMQNPGIISCIGYDVFMPETAVVFVTGNNNKYSIAALAGALESAPATAAVLILEAGLTASVDFIFGLPAEESTSFRSGFTG
jgi:hypothetical protein